MKTSNLLGRSIKKLSNYFPVEDWIITARRNYSNNVLEKKLQKGNTKQLSSQQIRQIHSFWQNFDKNANKLFDIRQYNVYNKYLVVSESDIVKYIPDDFYYCYADLFFTDYHTTVKLDNKNMYDLYFYDVNKPKCIIRNIDGIRLDNDYTPVSLEQAINLCCAEKKVIIKQTINSDGGHGIRFFEDCNSNKKELSEYLKNNKDYIVQEIIVQSDILGGFNANSINTIRIMTLFIEGEIKVLSSVFRIGINGAKVDNASSGGIVCGINSDGTLKDRAYDSSANVYKKHPQGKSFEGVIIPSYNECVNISKKLATRFINYSKLISWDFAIDKNNKPVLIEANLSGGQLDFHQLCNGPIWGDMTEDILRRIFCSLRK